MGPMAEGQGAPGNMPSGKTINAGEAGTPSELVERAKDVPVAKRSVVCDNQPRRVMMKFMQPGTRDRARVTMRWAIVTRLGRRVLVNFLGNAHRTDERGVALRVLGKVRRTMQLA